MGRRISTQITGEDRRPSNFYSRKTLASHPEALKIVLLRPRIPQNTGSIARMCAATGCSLHLVDPLFKLDDTKLKRAGLDYWPYLDVFTYASLDDWKTKNANARKWLLEINGTRKPHRGRFLPRRYPHFLVMRKKEYLPTGSANFPNNIFQFRKKNVRSLNLATSVGIVTFEALRQLNWYSLEIKRLGLIRRKLPKFCRLVQHLRFLQRSIGN